MTIELEKFIKNKKIWICIDVLGEAGGVFYQAIITAIELKKRFADVKFITKFKSDKENFYSKLLKENGIKIYYPISIINDYFKIKKIITNFSYFLSFLSFPIIFPLFFIFKLKIKNIKNFYMDNLVKDIFKKIFNRFYYFFDTSYRSVFLLKFFQNKNLFNLMNKIGYFNKPEIIHVFFHVGPENFINWGFRNKVKVIYYETSSADKNLPYYNKYFLESIKRTDAIFAMTENHAAKILKNFNYKGKIYNNVPSMILSNNSLSHCIKKCIKVSENINIGIAAGVVCNFKGFDISIKAMKVLKDRDITKIKLLLVGKEIDNRFRLLAKNLGVIDMVDFLGVVNLYEMEEFYKKIDIFVLPSKWEGIPTAIIEAMLHGIPVICTPVGEIPTVIKNGENGLFVNYRDYNELAKKISLLIDSPEVYLKISKNGLKSVEKFKSDYVINNIIENYMDLLSFNKRGS